MFAILPPLNRLLLLLAFALMVVVLPLVGEAQAQSCLSASQTRSVIASGAVRQLSQIVAAANARGYSQVGSAALCGSPGSYTYVVVASDASGRSARLTFNAGSGALLSER